MSQREPKDDSTGPEKDEKDEKEEPQVPEQPSQLTTPFTRIGLVVLIVLAVIFVWYASRLLLLIFAGLLFSIFLRTGAWAISRATKISSGWALLSFIVLLLGAATAAGVFLAPRLGEQMRQLTEAVPQAFSQLTARLEETTWGGWIVDNMIENGASPDNGTVVEHATSAARGVMDAVVAAVIVLFIGIYMAADPMSYLRGLLRLVPLPRRRRAGEVLFAAGYQLRWWLTGQILAMIVVGLMMGLGLALIGVPLAFALGVLAGLLEFIPTLGPPLAVIPAVLLAVVDEPVKGLYVLILYSVIQTVESYLLTPLVQQRVVHLKPVVTIAAQVFFAWTIGPIGLLVAVPLIAAVQIMVQMLYVQDFLGDDLPLNAAEEGRRELEEADVLSGA